jgi:hypothetical protein
VPLPSIAALMYEHVRAGGEISEVKETRPEWADHEYHYDLRLPIQNRMVYIETRLFFREPLVPDESWILVVNIHEC